MDQNLKLVYVYKDNLGNLKLIRDQESRLIRVQEVARRKIFNKDARREYKLKMKSIISTKCLCRATLFPYTGREE